MRMKTRMLVAAGGWMLLTGMAQAADDAAPAEPQHHEVQQQRPRAGNGSSGSREQGRERQHTETPSQTDQRYGRGYESRQRGAADSDTAHGERH